MNIDLTHDEVNFINYLLNKESKLFLSDMECIIMKTLLSKFNGYNNHSRSSYSSTGASAIRDYLESQIKQGE